MGRGLSEMQRRIMRYALSRTDRGGGIAWFDGWHRSSKDIIAGAIVGKRNCEMTPADAASVSRSLRRLEQRGLIVRVPWKTRTVRLILTSEGQKVAEALARQVADGDGAALSSRSGDDADRDPGPRLRFAECDRLASVVAEEGP